MAHGIVSASDAGDSALHSARVYHLASARQVPTSAPAVPGCRPAKNVVRLARERAQRDPALRQKLDELRSELEAARRSAKVFAEVTAQSRDLMDLGVVRLAEQVAAIERRVGRT